ncbi:hypothetical protein AMECASPLE_034875 [Ameca splendens]|uniref:RHD domain-containing protein n=1 Tax=Ameca splendens TaxID=208324 RepID=A0ABV0ZSQ0_9TELE
MCIYIYIYIDSYRYIYTYSHSYSSSSPYPEPGHGGSSLRKHTQTSLFPVQASRGQSKEMPKPPQLTPLDVKVRFKYQPDSPLQHLGIGLTREAEEYDLTIIGKHPPVSLPMKGEHHPGLPVQRHCPRPPCDVEEEHQPQPPQHPHSIQRLEVLRADRIHPQSLETMEFFYPPW